MDLPFFEGSHEGAIARGDAHMRCDRARGYRVLSGTSQQPSEGINAAASDQEYGTANSQKQSTPSSAFPRRQNGAWLKRDNHETSGLLQDMSDDEVASMAPLLSFAPTGFYLSGKPDPMPSQIHILAALPENPVPSFADLGWNAAWVERPPGEPGYRPPAIAARPREHHQKGTPCEGRYSRGSLYCMAGKDDTAEPELMEKIFKIDDLRPCIDLLFRFGGQIIDPVRAGDSKMSFKTRWDGPIRCVLDVALPDGSSDRDLSPLGSNGSCGLDYLFVLDSVCVFRGEEHAPGVPIGLVRSELLSKCTWAYGDVPYLFGYAAAGNIIVLYAISHASSDGVEATRLAAFNLDDVEQRLRLLLATLNISLLLRSLAKLCAERGRHEYKTFPHVMK